MSNKPKKPIESLFKKGSIHQGPNPRAAKRLSHSSNIKRLERELKALFPELRNKKKK